MLFHCKNIARFRENSFGNWCHTLTLSQTWFLGYSNHNVRNLYKPSVEFQHAFGTQSPLQKKTLFRMNCWTMYIAFHVLMFDIVKRCLRAFWHDSHWLPTDPIHNGLFGIETVNSTWINPSSTKLRGLKSIGFGLNMIKPEPLWDHKSTSSWQIWIPRSSWST